MVPNVKICLVLMEQFKQFVTLSMKMAVIKNAIGTLTVNPLVLVPILTI